MKTQEEKMQHIVEAAGECHHYTGGYVNPEIGEWTCIKCRAKGVGFNENPSPSDLNELFRLAEKLFRMVTIRFEYHRGDNIQCYLTVNNSPHYGHCGHGTDVKEALLNALYLATGGEE